MDTGTHLGEDRTGLPGQTTSSAGAGHRECGEHFRHDLRQPLAAASLLLEQLVHSPALEAATAARLREARRQVRWALELLRSQETDEPPSDLVEVGEAIARVVEVESASCEVSIVCTQRCYVVVPPTDLMRATRNLLDNAVHAATYVDGPRLVELTVSRRSGEAVLTVEDSGPGFGRVPVRHGVGLESVREFAERSGGSLTLGRSRWGGASVALRLPAAAYELVG